MTNAVFLRPDVEEVQMALAARPLWTPMTLGLTPTPGSSLRRKKKEQQWIIINIWTSHIN